MAFWLFILAAFQASATEVRNYRCLDDTTFVLHFSKEQAIVEFPDNSNVPSKFSMMKQEFGAPFPKVPSNDWGAPDGLDAASGCTTKVDD